MLILNEQTFVSQSALTGVNPSSSQPGVGEIDNFTGNGGRDRFIFGDARTAYYVGQGDVDHGIINDFSFADKDIIQLHGKAIDYEFIVQGARVQISLKFNAHPTRSFTTH